MARVSLVQDTDGPKNFYNVHLAVGPGAPNRRDDVFLVQYFLSVIFRADPGRFAQGPLAVDGRAGPQTFAAIRHFQEEARKKGHPLAQDGRVDSPVDETIRGSISRTQYTILSMNVGYALARPQDWPRVSKAADCPPEIRLNLREPVFLLST